MNEYDYYDSQFYYNNLRIKQEEKSEIRRIGNYAGMAIITMILIQNILVLLLNLFGLYEMYLNDSFFQLGMEMLIILMSMLIPFAFFGQRMQLNRKKVNLLPLGKPKDKWQFICAIPAGLGICMIANRVTTYIILIMNLFGLELSTPDMPSADGAFGIFATFFRITVFAAVIEEVCLRGFTMQNLRKYGDKFAIVMSAIVFGMMHCNLIQAPFALIVGIGLGYFCVKTNTLWTGIIIHALNNGISLTVSYLSDMLSEETLAVVYSFVTIFITLLGMICLFLFIRKDKAEKRNSDFAAAGYERQANYMRKGFENSTIEKVNAFLLNPGMIIAIGVIIYLTTKFVSFK